MNKFIDIQCSRFESFLRVDLFKNKQYGMVRPAV